jgi:hypothetical protein
MLSETSGDFVVLEQPKSVPTIKSVSRVTNNLAVFMFPPVISSLVLGFILVFPLKTLNPGARLRLFGFTARRKLRAPKISR